LKPSAKTICPVWLNPKVRGSKDPGSLFSIDEIKADFENYEYLALEETGIDLNEGCYYNGRDSDIRFVGRKNSIRNSSAAEVICEE
jgi:hypothetical protein